MTDDAALREQAEAITRFLPKLARGMFTIDENDPGMVIPVAQMRVCSILREGPRSMSALCNELGISHSAITQIADRLERSGMVERVPETADRRAKSLQLTPHCMEVMRLRAEKRLKRVLEALKLLDPEARESIVSSLEALLQACLASASELSGELSAREPAPR